MLGKEVALDMCSKKYLASDSWRGLVEKILSFILNDIGKHMNVLIKSMAQYTFA